MAVSNNIVAFLNFLALICSIPIIASGIWLAGQPDNECVRLVRWPLILLGVLLLLVALAGFAGAYWNHECLLFSYLLAMAILIAALLGFLIFSYVVTRPDGSYAVPGRAYDEYRAEGFSSWLRDYVGDPQNWDRVRACLSRSDVCGKLARKAAYFTADQFFLSDLSPLQSGCCKPPTACGYNYLSPTQWVNPTNQAADPDCIAWSNDQSQLCFNCNSCKAGTMGNLRKEWRKANVALIVATVALIFVYVVGCSAFKNAQAEDMFRKQGSGVN